MTAPASIITPNGVTLFLNNKPYNIKKDHTHYQSLILAIKQQDWDAVTALVDMVTTMQKYADKPGVFVDAEREVVLYNGQEIHNSLVTRLLNMHNEGFSIEPMIALLNNLMKNPSNTAINELYDFLEYGQMPITEDGCFLAYKRVNDNYTSCHDCCTDNSIGNTVTMDRALVDDRSHVTCSAGLHICSFEYLQFYPGARVIIVKVNPINVVSIPTDYNNTKARVCEYTVIGELTFEEANLPTHSFNTSVYTEQSDEYDDEGTDYYDFECTFGLDDDDFSTDPMEAYEYGFIVLEEDTAGYIKLGKPMTLAEEEQQDTEDFIRGYQLGYACGRTHTGISIDLLNNWSVAEGYEAGHKDGKGHKKNKHPQRKNVC